MKTIIYKKVKDLAGMASSYDYLVKYPNCVEEIKSLDYIIPLEKTSLILDGDLLRVSGSIFDLNTQTLKLLTN